MKMPSLRITPASLALAGLLSAGALSAQTTAPPKGASSAAPAATATAGQTGSSHTAGSGSATAGPARDLGIAPPAHPITLTQTREMLDLMGYKKLMTEMMDQNFAMQKQAAPFIPADVWSDLKTSFDNIDYAALLQPVYAKYLSQEDAAKALEFYRTPAGQDVLKTQPLLMREVIVTSQQNAQKTGRDVINKHRPEIEAAQKQYQEEQQKKAAPAGGAAGASGTPGANGARSGTSGAGAMSSSGAGAHSATPGNATPPASSTTPPQ